MQLKIEYLPIEALEEYKNNTRKHGDNDVKQILKSIKKFGMNDPIGIWSDHNVIVEGHGRLKACKKLGMKEVPCIRLDHLTDDERREYAIMHNKTAELSEWDFEMLDKELGEIDLSDFDFDFDLPEYNETERKKSDAFFQDKDAFDNGENTEEYEQFLEKFEDKHTTDDCYTPDNIYEAIADYVANYYNLDKSNFVRPFYPGGDYQKVKYKKSEIVVDNPPFSILSSIVRFYHEKNIRFFLFAPNTTVFHMVEYCSCVCPGCTITYENGAKVITNFLTNLDTCAVRSDSKLFSIIDKVNKENTKGKELPKFKYPANVLTAAMCSYMSKWGQDLKIERSDFVKIKELDSQKESKKQIFGSGLLLSTKAAAEKAAAEKAAAEKAAAEKAAAIEWSLSDRELAIIKALDEMEE